MLTHFGNSLADGDRRIAYNKQTREVYQFRPHGKENGVSVYHFAGTLDKKHIQTIDNKVRRQLGIPSKL